MKKILLLMVLFIAVAACSTDTLDSSRKLTEQRIIGAKLTPPLPAVGETLHVDLALYTGVNPSDSLSVSWNINNLSTVGSGSLALDLSSAAVKTLLTASEQKELNSKGKVRLMLTAALGDSYSEEGRVTRIEIPFTLTDKVQSDREENPVITSVVCDGFTPDNKQGEITHYTIPLDTKKVEFTAEIEMAEDDSDPRALFLDWNVGWDKEEKTFPSFERIANKITLYPADDASLFSGGNVTLFTLVRTLPTYSQPILFEFEEIHITFK